MGCKDWEVLLYDYAEGRLSGREAEAVHNHVQQCTSCSEHVAAWMEIVRPLKDESRIEPPDQLLARVLALQSTADDARREQTGRVSSRQPKRTRVEPREQTVTDKLILRVRNIRREKFWNVVASLAAAMILFMAGQGYTVSAERWPTSVAAPVGTAGVRVIGQTMMTLGSVVEYAVVPFVQISTFAEEMIELDPREQEQETEGSTWSRNNQK